MTSHHVTFHVTAMSHASSSSIKEKEIQKKRNIKSRKIDKRKRKILVSKAFHNMRGDKWQIEGDLVLKEGKIYVLKDEVLRMEIIYLYYNIPVVGHGGKWKMMELVTRNYWWPEVTRDMGKYVEGYDICQRMKNKIEELAEKLKLSEVLEKP